MRAQPLLLSLSVIVSACSERPADSPQASEPPAAAEEPPEPEPEPPKPPPVPTLAAVYGGDLASRLLTAGLAEAEPKQPDPNAAPEPPSEASSGALLASAAPAPAPAEAPAAAPENQAPSRARVAGPAIPADPRERPDDEVWTLPGAPAELVWTHPAPAAGLQVELLEARGRSWPTRVRIEPAGDVRVAKVVPLEPLPPGTDFRLVARVVAADGQSLLWTEPLRVKADAVP